MSENLDIELEDERSLDVTCARTANSDWLFVCHGFGGNKERQSEYLELKDKGLNVVTFSFRGNGDSSGRFINQDLSTRIEDLKTVVNHFDPENFVLFGTSFGAKVALHSTDGLNPEVLVLKSPVTFNRTMQSIRNAVEEKGEFEFIDGKPIDMSFFRDLDRYNFKDVASDIEASVIIFHGADDTTVHVENSLDAVKLMDTDVFLKKLEGEKHSFSEEAKKSMMETMSKMIKREI